MQTLCTWHIIKLAVAGYDYLRKLIEQKYVNILTVPTFQQFRETFDARMKELKCTGSYQPKRAEVIIEVHWKLPT